MQSAQTAISGSSVWLADFSRQDARGRWLVKNVLIPFALTRGLLLAAAWCALTFLPGARAFGWNEPTHISAIDMWSHFDGQWYLSIAKDGYQFIPNKQCNVVFAPLLPILMRAGGLLAGGSDAAFLVAGILIANLSLIVAAAYLVALMQYEGYHEKTAARAGWYLLVFPTSFFLSAVYPMSLFLALAIAAFYYARRNQWHIAGVLTGLAAVSRPDGVLLGVGLAVEYLQQHRFTLKRDCLWLACGPLALSAWLAFQWHSFGNPLAFIAVQLPWNYCSLGTALSFTHGWLLMIAPAIFIAMTIMAIRRLRPGYTILTIAMFSLMLGASRYWSITRFILVLFPCFMMLAIASRRWRWIHPIFTSLALLQSTLLIVRFSLNLWVA